MNDALLHIFPWLYIGAILLLFCSMHTFWRVKYYSILMLRIANSTAIFFLEIGRSWSNKFAAIISPKVFTVLKFFLKGYNLIITPKYFSNSRSMHLMVFSHHTIIFFRRLYLFDHKRSFCYLFNTFLCTFTLFSLNTLFFSYLLLLEIEICCLVKSNWVHIFMVLSLLRHWFFLSLPLHQLIDGWRIKRVALENP